MIGNIMEDIKMIGGNIRRYNGQSSGVNPDDYFDPSTHTATEENFLAFLDTKTYTSDVIGYKVVLSNSVDYNNGTWIIADVNHDSDRTGQGEYYDLISQDGFAQQTYGQSGYWGPGAYGIQDWCNTFLSGFYNDIYPYLIPVYCFHSLYLVTSYKVVIPSCTEMGFTLGGDQYSSYYTADGYRYPIFTDNNSRRISRNKRYWCRNEHLRYKGEQVWCVSDSGSSTYEHYTAALSVRAIIRLQHVI